MSDFGFQPCQSFRLTPRWYTHCC